MYYSPSQFSSEELARFKLFACIISTVENSVDPDQLASEKPADLDVPCFQTGIYPGD